EPVGRAQERGQPEVDEVDIGQGEDDVTRNHHAFREHVVHDVEKRGVLVERPRRGPRPPSAGGQRRPATKLYGGHGPVSRTWSPRSAARGDSSRTACRNCGTRSADTRNAASRSSAGRPPT